MKFPTLLLGLALSLMAASCVTLATDYRKVGFRDMQRSFTMLERSPDLKHTIHLKDVRVHIVGDRQHFKWQKAAAYGSPVLGYATRGNEIWVLGAMVDGKVVINQSILGHELNHLLNFANPIVADPDQLDDLGA